MLQRLRERQEWQFFAALPKADSVLATVWWLVLLLRGGTVVGAHSGIFAGPHERVELNHRAEDRAMFANGAARAALWAASQQAGLYSMADVLGLD